jgi:hypothetical protein
MTPDETRKILDIGSTLTYRSLGSVNLNPRVRIQSALRYAKAGYPYGKNTQGKKRWLRENRAPRYRITIINDIRCF